MFVQEESNSWADALSSYRSTTVWQLMINLQFWIRSDSWYPAGVERVLVIQSSKVNPCICFGLLLFSRTIWSIHVALLKVKCVYLGRFLRRNANIKWLHIRLQRSLLSPTPDLACNRKSADVQNGKVCIPSSTGLKPSVLHRVPSERQQRTPSAHFKLIMNCIHQCRPCAGWTNPRHLIFIPLLKSLKWNIEFRYLQK